jgi:hypothetical protein
MTSKLQQSSKLQASLKVDEKYNMPPQNGKSDPVPERNNN